MATVTITALELAAAIRAGDAPEIITELTRLRAVAILRVEQHAPEAPEEALNEAVVRFVGYLYDMPTVARGTGLANAMANSGAGALILPWRLIRAASTAEAVGMAQESVGSPGNPVVNVRGCRHRPPCHLR